MKNMNFNDAEMRSVDIRNLYHQLEKEDNGSEWTVEEDALAFLTDAGLVGRLVMAQQGRWPKGADSAAELEHKLGECMWWLIILAERMNINFSEALDHFLSNTEKLLEN